MFLLDLFIECILGKLGYKSALRMPEQCRQYARGEDFTTEGYKYRRTSKTCIEGDKELDVHLSDR